MRYPPFEPKAPKQTVSITLNSELYAKAKAVGINTSRVAEEALTTAYADHCRETARAEAQKDLAAAEAYAELHGAFALHVRKHHEREDDAV